MAKVTITLEVDIPDLKVGEHPEKTVQSVNRRSLYELKESILKSTPYLTVRYQELSAEGVPIFPVGISLRETLNEGY